MKIILLIATGRGGVDLIQSLFDKHPEVSQFPGIFIFGEFYKKIVNTNNLDEITEIFLRKYEFFFDSRKNKRERHDQLGENKNEHYLVSKKIFKENFINLFKDKSPNKLNILINLHLAYSMTCGEQIKKKKILIINAHQINWITEMEDINYEIIFSIRNPIASLSSSIKHWLQYDKGKSSTPWSTFYHIDRQFNALKKLVLKNNRIYLVKLEKLHQQSRKVLENLTKKLDIEFNECLLESTFHGKKWWGDSISKKYLNGLNQNFKNNIDYSFFYKKDIQIFEYYLKDIFDKYGYETSPVRLKNQLLSYLPLKIELIVLKRQVLNFNLKHFPFFFYYWFKRVNLMKNQNYKDINFPEEVGV